jgi:hypothetical protein
VIYHVGDRVIYQERVYYVVDGPTMGTEGSLYTLCETPPHTPTSGSLEVVGVWGHTLSPAPKD